MMMTKTTKRKEVWHSGEEKRKKKKHMKIKSKMKKSKKALLI